ncbi:MAG TPA: FAD-dependent oxidoreductase [Gemmatimonadaceae bacterium]|nr:FAD-dependent oxidoreductase [Gemmatimonadaceae bacterium]
MSVAPTPRWDVIVVGAGPAGSAVATFLARAGRRVLVLDRARFPRPKPCSEYMSPEASRLLAALGALDDVEAAGGAALVGMTVHAPGGARIHGEFAGAGRHRAFRDRGLAVRREVLDAILVRHARAAGAEVREGVRVGELLVAGGRVVGVRARGGGGDAQQLRARLVIGADGLRSMVARRLGLARTARWPRRFAFVTHYRGVAGVGSFGEMHVERGGYLGIADVGGGETNVALVGPAARARQAAGDPAGLVARWIAARPALAARFAGAERSSDAWATGPFASHARRAWAPGAALVGDAADFFDPFTGEGIFAALRGAELLAPFVEAALDARSSDAANDSLRAYDRLRRRTFRGKWLVERLIGAAVAWTPLLDRAARSLERRRDLADLLIGVTGDFVPPRAVLRPGFLLALLFPWLGPARAPSPSAPAA